MDTSTRRPFSLNPHSSSSRTATAVEFFTRQTDHDLCTDRLSTADFHLQLLYTWYCAGYIFYCCSTNPTQETRTIIGHADFSAYTRQHELDHTWIIQIVQVRNLSALRHLDHQGGIEDPRCASLLQYPSGPCPSAGRELNPYVMHSK